MGQDQEPKKKGWAGKFLFFLILLIIVFAAGVYAGRNYWGKVVSSLSSTAKTPIDAVKKASEKGSDFLTKEEIIATIEGAKTLTKEKKTEFCDTVEAAYRARSEGKITGSLLVDWQEAEKLYEAGKSDNALSDSEIEAVVKKFGEIVQKAR